MKQILITEVGPRDGLQNEPVTIPTEIKIAFINALSQTGVQEIEVSSFVSPKWVPQLADAEKVCQTIERSPNIIYSALVPNERGFESALKCKMKKISVFTAASESFNQKNINASIAESIIRFEPVLKKSREFNMLAKGYVSTAFHCPYEGAIEPKKVREVVKTLVAMGVDEISLGDTIGKASPRDVRKLLELLLKDLDVDHVSLHFHDTYGMAIANALLGFHEFGITRFDASAGGLGGCPYAPGAAGNIATEDLCYALIREGALLRVDFSALMKAIQLIAPFLKRPVQSKLFQASVIQKMNG